MLRGPASGLYGSDAIGGVVNIITKTGSSPPHIYGSLEGGRTTPSTRTGGTSGSIGGFSYNFDFAHYHSRETDVTPSGLVPRGVQLNPDYYDSRTSSTKLGARLTDNPDVGAVLRYVDTDLNSTSDDSLSSRRYRRLSEATAATASSLPAASHISPGLMGASNRPSASALPGIGATSSPQLQHSPLATTLRIFTASAKRPIGKASYILFPAKRWCSAPSTRSSGSPTPIPPSAHVTNDAGYIGLQSEVTDHIFAADLVRAAGGLEGSSVLHIARTMVRRAEPEITELAFQEPITPPVTRI